MRCDWEQQVLEATRSGSWTSPLRAHLQECSRCVQTELIAASLQKATAVRSLDLPPASLVWRRAQTRQRERARQRAIRRPFLISGALGVIYALMFLLWSVFQLPPSVYRWLALSPGQNGGVTFVGASLAAIVAIAGSFVFMTEKER